MKAFDGDSESCQWTEIVFFLVLLHGTTTSPMNPNAKEFKFNAGASAWTPSFAVPPVAAASPAPPGSVHFKVLCHLS